MNQINWRQLSFLLNIIGCAQFVLFTFLGMLLYAGGTYSDPSIPGYSFFLNFFSDIGRTIAHSGESNIISFVFFSLAFFLVGILLVPSFLAFPGLFNDKKYEKIISVIGSIIGLFTAFCLSGITFAPSNISPAAHGWFVRAGFLSGFFISIFYSLVISLNNFYPKRYALNFITFTAILGLYIILLFFGPSSQTIEGLMINVTGQKIVLYTFATCLFIHGYGAWKLTKSRKEIH